MESSIKIKRISTILQYACYIVIFITIAASVYIGWLSNTAPEKMLVFYHDELQQLVRRFWVTTGLRRLFISIVVITPTVLGLYSYWRLSKMFSLFRRDLYFTEEAANHLFIFSLLTTLVLVFSNMLLGLADFIAVVGTGEQPYGMVWIIDGGELTQLIAAVSFMLISWIIREGARLQLENEGFL